MILHKHTKDHLHAKPQNLFCNKRRNVSSESDMEFLASLFTFLFMVLLLKLGSRFKSKCSTSNLPPGPRKLPLIGNLHQLAAAGSLPHHTMRDLAKKYGPIMHLQLGEVSTIVVSSPETAKEVMKTHDIVFASRPPLLALKILSYDCTNISFSPYGEYWRQLRKIATLELLSAKRVKSFRPIRDEETSSLIRWITCNEGKPINVTEKLYSLVFGTASRMAFGKKNEEQETFVHLISQIIKLISGFNIADVYPSIKLFHLISGVNSTLEKMFLQSDRILGNIVNEHRTRTNDGDCKDLVDVLLKYQEDKNMEFKLTDNNIKAVILDIFGAGGETSATTIDWAMSEMLRKPCILKKAQDEVRQTFRNKGYVDEEDFDKLTYLKSVIKETMRLHPILPLLLPRENRERCEIDGFEIPVKSKIIVNAWAINRDPRYWKDAECFIPERFLDSSIDYKGTNFEYIPFGAGRRMCPGMTFGLANVELALAKLLYHFDWSLPSEMKPEEMNMTEEFGATARRKDDLYLIPVVINHL